METFESYSKLLNELGDEAFLARFPHGFFVRRKTREPVAGGAAVAGPRIDRFETITKSGDGMFDLPGLVPLLRRDKSPFTDRITVGRATNCDVLLILPTVSKLHAQLWLGERGAIAELSDEASSNGTKVNDLPVKAGERVSVAPGDRMCFGKLVVEWCTTATVVEILRMT